MYDLSSHTNTPKRTNYLSGALAAFKETPGWQIRQRFAGTGYARIVDQERSRSVTRIGNIVVVQALDLDIEHPFLRGEHLQTAHY